LLVSEFRRLLSDDDFRLLVRRDTKGSEDAAGVPRASVYAIEAQGRAREVEAVAASIAASNPGARMLVISEALEEEAAFPLLRLGTKGLLLYSEVEPQLARALTTIATGGYWVPRALLSRFLEETLGSARKNRPLPSIVSARRLSRREAEVMELLLRNLSNKEIAKELHISSRTAKFHVSNILSKHGVRRRADLILLAHTQPPVQ
jgi:DNA-binding NarL/FixJ family response regulator